MPVKMPVSLVSSVPSEPGPASDTFTNQVKLKRRDPLLQIGQKRCLVGVVEIFWQGWFRCELGGWLLLFWVTGLSSVPSWCH